MSYRNSTYEENILHSAEILKNGVIGSEPALGISAEVAREVIRG
jgi:hypothetical protein